MAEDTNPRRVAQQILTAILRDRGSLNRLERHAGHPDIAFIQALCYGVCRHYHELAAEAACYLSKPLRSKDTDILCLILMGLFQLRHMRVPDHAVLHETVACVRKPWARGLVNAVLRQAQRSGAPPPESLADEEARSNHPRWLLERLRADWPDELEAILAANNARAPMTLRINRQRVTREDYLASLSAANLGATPGRLCDTALILDSPLPVAALPGFAEGRVSVQDEASQLAAGILPVQPGQTLLDACAAPGGKTAALLEREPALNVLALDSEAERLGRVQETLGRLGLEARLHCADARDWASDARDAFDHILLDAPCSGSGVIRRHPDIRLLRSPEQIDRLCELQAGLLEALWPRLASGGHLLYTTCSILKRENSEQIMTFLSRHPDARLLPLPFEWGIGQPAGRQLLPGVYNQDGFFYALLEKY